MGELPSRNGATLSSGTNSVNSPVVRRFFALSRTAEPIETVLTGVFESTYIGYNSQTGRVNLMRIVQRQQ